jgi:preprotein translocase subunit SecD
MTGGARFAGALLLGGAIAVAGGCGQSSEPTCDLVIAGLAAGAPIPNSGDALLNVAEVVANPADIDWAASTLGQDQVGQPEITLQLRPEAAARMAEFTRTHVGEYMPLALNGRVMAVPIIMSPIPNGEVAISGAQNDREMTALAACVSR